MPEQRHYYGLNHLHFLTANVCRRACVFGSDRFQGHFVRTLNELRGELNFKIIGYVLMPEHCHLLIWPSEVAKPSQIMQKLSERTAKFILRNLRRKLLSQRDFLGNRIPVDAFADIARADLVGIFFGIRLVLRG